MADSRSYLAGLPDSERLAKELLSWGEAHFGELGDGGRFPFGAVHLLEPVEIAALFDFGLTPRHLKNSAEVNGKLRHQGSTSGISHKAEDVFAWLRFIAPLKPGSVMGLGTIPECTGLDHDDFVDPGAAIEITFERLGTLRCRFAEPTGRLLPSRWPLRETLRKYQG